MKLLTKLACAIVTCAFLITAPAITANVGLPGATAEAKAKKRATYKVVLRGGWYIVYKNGKELGRSRTKEGAAKIIKKDKAANKG